MIKVIYCYNKDWYMVRIWFDITSCVSIQSCEFNGCTKFHCKK